jgi:hypothetical protein
MLVRLNGVCQPFPTQVHCNAFHGQIEFERVGGKPPLLGLASHVLLSIFGVPNPYRTCATLRDENGRGLIAVCTESHAGSFQSWRANIIVSDLEYQLRREHLPARKKIFFNGDKVIASDENGEVVTAIVDHTKPGHGTIIVTRLVQGIEAVLAFLFMEARELDRGSRG